MRNILLNIEIGTPSDFYLYPKKYLLPFISMKDRNNKIRVYTMDWLLKNREERAIETVFKKTRSYYT